MSVFMITLGWLMGVLGSLGSIITAVLLKNVIAFFVSELSVISFSAIFIALGTVLDNQLKIIDNQNALQNKIDRLGGLPIIIGDKKNKDNYDRSLEKETESYTTIDDNQQNDNEIKSLVAGQEKSDMVVCRHCGKLYKYNNFGCIFCHRS